MASETPSIPPGGIEDTRCPQLASFRVTVSGVTWEEARDRARLHRAEYEDVEGITTGLITPRMRADCNAGICGHER